LQDDFIYELHYREKKSQQYVMLNAEMGYTLGFQILDICSLEPVARKCRVALSKVCFEPDFFAFRSVLFLQQTSLLQTVSELDRYINIE